MGLFTGKHTLAFDYILEMPGFVLFFVLKLLISAGFPGGGMRPGAMGGPYMNHGPGGGMNPGMRQPGMYPGGGGMGGGSGGPMGGPAGPQRNFPGNGGVGGGYFPNPNNPNQTDMPSVSPRNADKTNICKLLLPSIDELKYFDMKSFCGLQCPSTTAQCRATPHPH